MTYSERKKKEDELLRQFRGKRGTLTKNGRTFSDLYVRSLTIGSEGTIYVGVGGGSIDDGLILDGWHKLSDFQPA
jgi:hypothetical protein